MRLGIRPAAFLGRLLVWFFLTYALWRQIAPAYTQWLAALAQGCIHLTELSSDPRLHRVTTMWAQGSAILFWNRVFPQPASPPSIAAEWIEANLVLLIPLMLATPAASWAQKARRCALALGFVIFVQVIDVGLAVKYFYSTGLELYSATYYSDRSRFFYTFATNFWMAMDTQVAPFAIWAGIHLNQLLGRTPTVPAARAAGPRPPGPRPQAPRRKLKAERRQKA